MLRFDPRSFSDVDRYTYLLFLKMYSIFIILISFEFLSKIFTFLPYD